MSTVRVHDIATAIRTKMAAREEHMQGKPFPEPAIGLNMEFSNCRPNRIQGPFGTEAPNFGNLSITFPATGHENGQQ